MTRPGLRATLIMLPALAALVSCRTTKFYSQAVRGQMQVLARAKPIAEVRAAPDTEPELRRKLGLVESLRAFAKAELKLPTDRQYRSYADLGRRYVVWNVVAAPEFSVEAKTWSYPLVGKLKYRGFFNEQAARGEAQRLKAEGFDVAVGGVRVYSTLGWFSDPVLNTFIREEEAELAETLFHELTHARFFVSGDTDFNEAYATASAQLAVRQWLRAKGDARAMARYEEELRRNQRLLDLLKATRSTLSALYAKRATMPDEEMRRAKVRILEEARARHATLQRPGNLNGGAPLSRTLNNARLAAIAAYHDLVPAFTRLFHGHGGDWEKFHRAVEAMKPLSKAERRRKLGETRSACPVKAAPQDPNATPSRVPS